MIESGRTSDFDQNGYPVARAELSQPPASKLRRFGGLSVKCLTFFVNHV